MNTAPIYPSTCVRVSGFWEGQLWVTGNDNRNTELVTRFNTTASTITSLLINGLTRIFLATVVEDITKLTVDVLPYTLNNSQYVIQDSIIWNHTCPSITPTVTGSNCDTWKST